MTAPLTTNVEDFATRLGTEFKTAYGRIGDLAGLDTTAKTNLVAAVNEVNASVASASGIDDEQTSTSTSWSSSKTDTEIGNAVAGKADTAHGHVVADVSDFASAVDARIETRLDVSTADLDTFREVAEALADNDSAVATINSELATRVRHDAAQTIADGGTQARANIGAASAADVGDVTGFDPVATFETALS